MPHGVEISSEEMEQLKASIITLLKEGIGRTFYYAVRNARAGDGSTTVSVSTAYEWRAADKAFDKAVKEAVKQSHENGLDLAESKLIEKINGGETTPILFYLKTKGRNRGYIERNELTGLNGAALNTVLHEETTEEETQAAIDDMIAAGRGNAD
jgi:hypothetical protein